MNVAHDAALRAVQRSGHICWVVDRSVDYVEIARSLLAHGAAAGKKAVVFGPSGSTPLAELAADAAIAADPAHMHGSELDPQALIALFREQAALARNEGFAGLCLVNDMDWLMPTGATTEAIVTFELLLDAAINEADATVVCAYRTSSFDTAAIERALSVHPGATGNDEPTQFRIVAGAPRTWHVSGEVDVAVTSTFTAAMQAVTAEVGTCVLDLTMLDFIDVAGMRAIAEAAQQFNTAVLVTGASPVLSRHWRLCRFDEAAPSVAFA